MYGRGVILILSYQRPEITKIFFYYGKLMELIVQVGLPIDTGIIGGEHLSNLNVLDFVLNYFSYWPSAIISILLM